MFIDWDEVYSTDTPDPQTVEEFDIELILEDLAGAKEALREALEEKERWRKLAVSHARTIAELEALLS